MDDFEQQFLDTVARGERHLLANMFMRHVIKCTLPELQNMFDGVLVSSGGCNFSDIPPQKITMVPTAFSRGGVVGRGEVIAEIKDC